MARVKIFVPSQFRFTTQIPVRISDLNYGGHVGNEVILTMAHEARIQFLRQYGYSELDMGGTGLIMADAAIEYKSELFYGDIVSISLELIDVTRVGFDVIYQLEKEGHSGKEMVALVKTGMICFNYETRKVASVPADVKKLFFD